MILSLGSGTSAAPHAERKDDLYETPPEAVRSLIAVEALDNPIWEPACGPGSIVRALEAAPYSRAVISSDLVDYGWGHESGVDFLLERRAPLGVQSIVTNPPFKLAEQFAAHAVELVPHVCMLLRLAFLEGLRWNERMLSRHLARVHVFAPRLPFMHRDGYEGKRISNSAMPMAWFVWERTHQGDPTIGWVDWRKYR